MSSLTESGVSPSRRQLMAASTFWLASGQAYTEVKSSLLWNVSEKVEEFSLFAPDACFLDFAIDDKQSVQRGDVIVRFDPSDFLRDKFRLLSRLEHVRLSSERTTAPYTEDYLYLPLRAQINLGAQAVSSLEEVRSIAEAKYYLGTGLDQGGVDSLNVCDRRVSEARARLCHYQDMLIQKQAEISSDNFALSQEELYINREVQLLDKLISSCTVKSPLAGTVRMATFTGAFADRAQLLATVRGR